MRRIRGGKKRALALRAFLISLLFLASSASSAGIPGCESFLRDRFFTNLAPEQLRFLDIAPSDWADLHVPVKLALARADWSREGVLSPMHKRATSVLRVAAGLFIQGEISRAQLATLTLRLQEWRDISQLSIGGFKTFPLLNSDGALTPLARGLLVKGEYKSGLGPDQLRAFEVRMAHAERSEQFFGVIDFPDHVTWEQEQDFYLYNIQTIARSAMGWMFFTHLPPSELLLVERSPRLVYSTTAIQAFVDVMNPNGSIELDWQIGRPTMATIAQQHQANRKSIPLAWPGLAPITQIYTVGYCRSGLTQIEIAKLSTILNHTDRQYRFLLGRTLQLLLERVDVPSTEALYPLASFRTQTFLSGAPLSTHWARLAEDLGEWSKVAEEDARRNPGFYQNHGIDLRELYESPGTPH